MAEPEKIPHWKIPIQYNDPESISAPEQAAIDSGVPHPSVSKPHPNMGDGVPSSNAIPFRPVEPRVFNSAPDPRSSQTVGDDDDDYNDPPLEHEDAPSNG